MIDFQAAVQQILTYFTDSLHHRDADPLHVSEDELARAKENLPAEAAALVNLVSLHGDLYWQMTAIQTEGRINDVAGLSLRDLYAIQRGTGYLGEDITAALERLKKLFEKTEQADIDAKALFESQVQTIVDNAAELDENVVYQVTIRTRRQKIGFDWENSVEASDRTLTVGRATYDAWQTGQVLSTKKPAFLMLDSKEWGTVFEMSVQGKSSSVFYSYRDTAGSVHRVIDEKIYAEAKRRILAGGKATEVALPHGNATYMTEEPLDSKTIIDRVPFKRHYATLRIDHDSRSLNFSKQVQSGAVTHDVEIEVPTFSASAADLGIEVSDLNATVLSQREEEDSRYEEITLKGGRKVVVAVAD